MRTLLLIAAFAVALSTQAQSTAHAGDPMARAQVWAHNFAMNRPWHGRYYNQNYGQPLAVVVPPNVSMQQTYSWGVSQNLSRPLHHQYGRSAPGMGAAPRGSYLPTPHWPSHTDQFGYYYIRAPW